MGRLVGVGFCLLFAGVAISLAFDEDPRIGWASRVPMLVSGALFGVMAAWTFVGASFRGLRGARMTAALGLVAGGLGIAALGSAPIDGPKNDAPNASFVVVGGASLLAGIFLAFRTRERATARLELIAVRTGATITPWSLRLGCEARRDTDPLSLRAWDHDDAWGFEIRGPWSPDVAIERQRLTVRQTLDGETLHTGDAAFDRAVFLHGDPASLRPLLDAPGRATVLRSIELGAGVRNGAVLRAGTPSEAAEPEDCVAAGLALANLLTRPVHETSALAEIAATDPLPGVRRVALLALCDRDRTAGWRACENALEDTSADVRRAAAEWILAHDPGEALREHAERTLRAITEAGGELSLDEANMQGALSDAEPSKAGAVSLGKPPRSR